jgi:Zn-dependent membrane protease YugP
MIHDPVYLILIVGAMIASQLVGGMLQRRFRQFSQIPLRLTGAQVAEKMLRENGISDVEVISVPGQLTDHYHPQKKTVNLSEAVYAQNSVAAAAVAAHECGHAVQHAKAYAPLQMRSALVPVVSIGSRLVPFLFIAGIVLGLASPLGYYALLGAVVLFGGTTLFSLITLPVEFDASRRALAWIGGSGIMSSADQDKAQSALKWAALTYVVAALASLGQLLYYVMLLAGGRRD